MTWNLTSKLWPSARSGSQLSKFLATTSCPEPYSTWCAWRDTNPKHFFCSLRFPLFACPYRHIRKHCEPLHTSICLENWNNSRNRGATKPFKINILNAGLQKPVCGFFLEQIVFSNINHKKWKPRCESWEICAFSSLTYFYTSQPGDKHPRQRRVRFFIQIQIGYQGTLTVWRNNQPFLHPKGAISGSIFLEMCCACSQEMRYGHKHSISKQHGPRKKTDQCCAPGIWRSLLFERHSYRALSFSYFVALCNSR